jgi:four helix bundle protein
LCRPFGPRLKRFNPRLGAQLTEALASTLQNLAEAMRRTGSDRAHLLSISLGSCDEVRALLDAALAFGVLSASEQQGAEALADRVCAMTYRLRQRCM